MLSSHCVIVITALLVRVESATKAPTNFCTFPSHTQPDKALNQLKAEHFVGKSYNVTDKAGGRNYTVGICVNVNSATAGGNTCDAAMQYKAGEESHVIGRCNNTEVLSGSDWAMVIYGDGDRYPHACEKQHRRTMIMITCNCSAGDGILKFINEDFEKTNSSCLYMFELYSQHICPNNCTNFPKPTPPPSPFPAINSGELSGGSIFLIIFFTVAGAYLLIGFVIQFCSGHTGIELIPNVYFWFNFFALIADGCDFVFRCGPYAHSRLQIDGDFPADYGVTTSHRRGPLTPPPSSFPPPTPTMSDSSSGYQNTGGLSSKGHRPVSATESLTGEAGSLAGTSTSDDTYLIQA